MSRLTLIVIAARSHHSPPLLFHIHRAAQVGATQARQVSPSSDWRHVAPPRLGSVDARVFLCVGASVCASVGDCKMNFLAVTFLQ